MSIRSRWMAIFCSVTLPLALSACKEEEQIDPRLGRWTLDVPAMEAAREGDPDGLGMTDQAFAFLKRMEFDLRLHEDHTFEAIATLDGAEKRVGGTWAPTESGMVVTATTKNGQYHAAATMGNVTLLDRDHLRMRDPDIDRVMLFVRVTGDPAPAVASGAEE